jgi:hypothetical protein
MKLYDVLHKRTSNDKKTNWDKVGVLISNEGKYSLKLDLIPAGNWDGWLIIKDRKQSDFLAQALNEGNGVYKP